MEHEHIIAAFDEELDDLKRRLLEMGDKVLLMLDDSIRSVVCRDTPLAESTIAADHEVDAAEVAIDAFCLELLARRQPAARDLRLITAVMKIVTNLERIGDKCVSIAKRARELNQEPKVVEYHIDIPRMSHWAAVMVKEALNAFTQSDANLADKVLKDSRTMDEFNDRIQRVLLTYVLENPASSPRVMKLGYVSKALDRIADHASSMAKMVYFTVKGMDIRHSGNLDR